jgi:molecular chaperone HscB
MPLIRYDFFPKTLAAGPPPSGAFHIDIRELR